MTAGPLVPWDGITLYPQSRREDALPQGGDEEVERRLPCLLLRSGESLEVAQEPRPRAVGRHYALRAARSAALKSSALS
jgi:hypothetical protein